MAGRAMLTPMVRRVLGTLVILVAVGCSSTPEPPSPQPEQPRLSTRGNVLLITLDTLRADHVGCYGAASIPTPVLDGLAAGGVRFEQAVVQVPLTTPSHASILTGAYPQVHKIRDVGGFVLDAAVPTAASLLSSAGYETAAFVSAAVLHRRYGLNRGFQVYVDDMQGNPDEEKLPGVVAEVRAETTTARALEWLKQRDSAKPFFLWLHYYDPHFPYDPPEPFKSRFPKNGYAGEVAYLDSQLAPVFTHLEGAGLKDKTLVVVLADHGEGLGDHGEQTHGVFLYDVTMRVPMIIAGPGIAGNRVVEQQVRSIDVTPTMLDFAGLNAVEPMQGETLMPLLLRDQPVRTNYSYMETLYPKTQMRWSELRAMRSDRWKLVIAPKPELYDLVKDRAEQSNLIANFPAEADRLQKQVWAVDGPPGTVRKIEPQNLDEQTRQELQSLGYVSAGASREIVADLSGPDPKDKVAVLKSLDEATDLMNVSRYRESIPILRAALATDPGNPLIYQHLGLCYQETGGFAEALKTYQDAIARQADTDRTFGEMGEVLIRLGRLQEGTEALRKSSEINPRNFETLGNLANAYLQLGKIADARKAALAILAQNSTHATAHNLLGMTYVQERRPDLAQKEFEAALAADPDLVEPYMNLGLLAQLRGDRIGAAKHFRDFLARAKDPQYREIAERVEAALRELELGG